MTEMAVLRRRLHGPIAVLATVAGCAGAPAPCPEAPIAGGEEPPAEQTPAGYVQVEVTPMQRTDREVHLTEVGGDRRVTVGLARPEAEEIERRQHGQDTVRPSTHDLLDSVLRYLQGRVLHVRVDPQADGSFVATVAIWDGGEVLELDARTWDAIAIAVGHQAPVYLASSALDAAAP